MKEFKKQKKKDSNRLFRTQELEKKIIEYKTKQDQGLSLGSVDNHNSKERGGEKGERKTFKTTKRRRVGYLV